MPALQCARVDCAVAARVTGCRALGYPLWKGSPARPLLAQADGFVPTAEGADPRAGPGDVRLLTFKITTPQIRDVPVPRGALDQPGSRWAGMSGAGVLTEDDLVAGVVRSHAVAEGVGSLTVTPLDAVTALPADTADRFWAALGLRDTAGLLTVPAPAHSRLPVAAGQVVVGDIPQEPVAFVARATVDRLADALGGGRVAVVCAVTGLRGVGKTHVAAAFARQRAASGCGLVGWVAAESATELFTGMTAVAGTTS